MPDARWKAFERWVASRFGGTRRGPLTRSCAGGQTDVEHPHYAIECKHGKRLGFADFAAAVAQAERNGTDEQTPVAVVHRVGDPFSDSLVVMRIGEFCAWFVGSGPDRDMS